MSSPQAISGPSSAPRGPDAALLRFALAAPGLSDDTPPSCLQNTPLSCLALVRRSAHLRRPCRLVSVSKSCANIHVPPPRIPPPPLSSIAPCPCTSPKHSATTAHPGALGPCSFLHRLCRGHDTRRAARFCSLYCTLPPLVSLSTCGTTLLAPDRACERGNNISPMRDSWKKPWSV